MADSQRICSVDGCGKRIVGRGMCRRHYVSWWRLNGGSLQTRNPEICTVEGCGKPAEKRTWCSMHYRRWRVNGDVNIVKPNAGGRKKRLIVPVCLIDGCERDAVANGWCGMHYQRNRNHGDPLKRITPANGEALRYFYDVVSSYQGNDCLIWPFSKDKHGYGQLMLQGKRKIVSRLSCEIENGPPPAPNLDAAHSCGNGHLGCCSRKHMRWATRKENVADAIAHGTLKGRRSKPK